VEVISGLEAELFYYRQHADGTLKKETVSFVESFSFDISEELLFKKAINVSTFVSVYKGPRAVRGSFSLSSLMDIPKLLNVVGVNYVDNGAALKKIGTEAASWAQSTACNVIPNYSFDTVTRLFQTTPKCNSWGFSGTNEYMLQKLNIPYALTSLLPAFVNTLPGDDILHTVYLSYAIKLVSGCITVRLFGIDDVTGDEKNVLLLPNSASVTEAITVPVPNKRLRQFDLDSLILEISSKFDPASTADVPILNITNPGEGFVTNLAVTESNTGQFVDRAAKAKLENSLFLEYFITRNTGDVSRLVFTGVVIPTFSLQEGNDVNIESVSFVASDIYILDSNTKALNENWGIWSSFLELGG